MKYWNDPDDPTLAEGDLETACERYVLEAELDAAERFENARSERTANQGG